MTNAAPTVLKVASRTARTPRPLWESGYATILAVLDAVLITVAALVALRWNVGSAEVLLEVDGPLAGQSYALVVVGLTPAWVLSIALRRGYESGYLGVGSEEFKRVVSGSIRLAAALCVLAVSIDAQVSRGFLLTTVLLGTALLVLGRFAGRKGLHALRRRGRCRHRVVVVGARDEVVALTNQIDRSEHAGFEVVAVCLPDYEKIPVFLRGRALQQLGAARDVAPRLAAVGADTVAVAGTSALSSRELRELAWDLEGSGVDLVVSPAITDVAGPRIRIRPVAGLPLLHVEEPTFGGARKVVKGSIDLASAAFLLVLLAPVLVVLGVLVRRGSAGPAFFRQVRVGRDGRHFRIWKFRSMRVGADRELAGLAAQNELDGPLFKMRDDPRITSTGRLLRRFSLDELPQLFNVLNGTMSLVGPRPPLPSEVEAYADHVHRRLLVKPGITGLWQVSGRADLEWDEAVRLDLYYVENWSVAMDVMILWKTVSAVLRSRGAY